MAKLSMKDYANFLEEEERQDRLQEELEYKRFEEDLEAAANWRDYQEDQKAKKYEEQYYKDYGYHYPEYEDDYDPYDLLDAEVPCQTDSFLAAEDLYDMYAYACGEDDCYCEPEDIDFLEEQIISGTQQVEEDTVDEKRICKKSVVRNQQEERICKKAILRNRNYASKKEKKRDKMVSEIINEQYRICKKKNRKRRKRLKKLKKVS